MYLIPVTILYGHPDIDVGLYIWKSMVPTALGNTLGGGMFIEGSFWCLYLTGPGSENSKVDLGGLDSAMEAGGPIGPSNRKAGANSQRSQEEKYGTFTKGKGPKDSHPSHAGSLLSSDQRTASGLGRELSAEAYTHRRGELTLTESRAV